MTYLDENSPRDLTLTSNVDDFVSSFNYLKPRVKRELAELKDAKWDVWRFFESYLRIVYELNIMQQHALEDVLEEDSKQTREHLSRVKQLIEKAKRTRPLLFDLFFASRKVRDQIGPRCAEDVAKAANKYKIPGFGSGKITTNQVISVLNRFAILNRNQAVECQEKETQIYRIYLGCIDVLGASASDAAYKDDILLKKRQGGNFVGILSRFAQRKDNKNFFRRMESIKRMIDLSKLSDNEKLSDDEITIATVHCLELTTTFIGSLSERKRLQRKAGLPFSIDTEINILKQYIGEKLSKNIPLSGLVIKDYAHSPHKE